MSAAANPFTGQDVRWLLDAQVERRGDQEALVWRPHDGPREAWTYSELRADVDRVAFGLAARGVVAGDRVCVHLDNRPEFLLAWLAVQTLGAVLVATNTRSSPEELAYLLEASSATVVVTEVDHLDTVESALCSAPTVRALLVVGGAVVGGTVAVEPFDVLLSGGGAPRRVDIDPMAPAGIQFTSGTTARPKGVVWTHANYLWGGRVSAAHEDLRAADRHLTFLPLFHTNAQSYSVMASLWAGATIVLLPRFSARRFWPVAVEERATCCSLTPFVVKALRDQPAPADHCFRVWAGPIAVARWEERFGLSTIGWWGMTETVSHPVVSPTNLPSSSLSMGRPAPEYRVRVIGDDGDVIAAGSGLLEVEGVPGISLMAGYLDDPDATRAAYTDDGWLKTGDRVELHADGWLSFLERDKDMLKVGGENVAAAEIERVIGSVAGVAEVAVVAGRHAMLDEIPVAFVIPSDEGDGTLEPRILEACESRLADFKVPKLIVIVEALPRSTLEKVAKNVLRQRADELLSEPVPPSSRPRR